MKINKKELDTKYVNILSTEKVNDIINRGNSGEKLKKSEHIWFDNEFGVRKAGLKFAATTSEIEEYVKCKMDINYFADNYCKIKRENGTVGQMKLRDYQKDILNVYQHKYCILMCSRQMGKAQDLNSIVWDKNGKKRFGDLKINDEIFGDDGELTKVIGIYSKGFKDIYEIEFSDGMKVRCCAEHLWEVENNKEIKVIELNEIIKNYKSNRYYVKINSPVKYEKRDFPIDPYIIGTTENIPNGYLYGSIEQRISLLQGIMDTAGESNEKYCEYKTTNEKQCNDFRELCCSLGIKTHLIKTDIYTIRIFLRKNYEYQIFKNKEQVEQLYDFGQKRLITNITYIGVYKAQCIEVDNDSHLYLTDNYIPTHNTITASITLLHYVLFNSNKNVMIVANKGKTVEEIIDKIKNIYKLLPFFLKSGIKNWNMSSIILENGCRILTEKRSTSPSLGFSIDFLYLDEFAHIPKNIIEPYYTAVIPILSSIENSRMIITSTPKGMNLFYKLLIESELPHDDPNWNGFYSMRAYWWEIKGRRDTKIFYFETKMRKYSISKQDIEDELNKYKLKFVYKTEDNSDGIFVLFDRDNENCSLNFIKQLRIKNIPISEFCRVTNWEQQQIKAIGGEDAFKQEFGLEFLTGNKLLFDSAYIEELYENKKEFGYYDIPNFNKRLNIPYTGLNFVKNDLSLFDITKVKEYSIFIGIDLAEGLGEDFSVFNIFRLVPKTQNEITRYKSKFADIYDYFKLEQIGVFKSNNLSVEEVAHILYMICFEFFDCDKVRVVLERNTYGDTLLAHIPNVFNQENDYSNHIFLRYKAKAEDKTTKMGIKVTRNKKLLIKDYQIQCKKGNVVLHDKYTIQEVSTFTKQDTPSGDITFKSESGHDDHIMSCITLSTCFNHIAYHDAVDQMIENMGGDINKLIINEKEKSDEEKPDLASFTNSYSKIYKNNTNNNRGFNSQMNRQFRR